MRAIVHAFSEQQADTVSYGIRPAVRPQFMFPEPDDGEAESLQSSLHVGCA